MSQEIKVYNIYGKDWEAEDQDEVILDANYKTEFVLKSSHESALDVAVEALSSMHIDTPMGWNLDNPENVTYEIAIGWHKSNNEKIEAALDKIKQIRGE